MSEDTKASTAREELQMVLGAGGLQAMALDGQPSAPSGTGEQAEESRESKDSWSDRDRKWRRMETGKGPSRDGWAGWGNKRQWPKEAEDKEEAVLDKATQEVIKSLVQLSLRHEAELGRLRADCGFMLFLDTPQTNPAAGIMPGVKEVAVEWSKQFAAGTVKSPLRNLLMMAIIKELQTRLTAFLQDEDRCARAISAGWMAEGHNALDPVWNYWGWNPKEKRQEKTDQQPMQTTAVQAQLQLLEANIAKEGVLLNFRSTKDLEKEQDLEVVPFMITVGLRAPESHARHTGHFSSSAGVQYASSLGPGSGRRDLRGSRWQSSWRRTICPRRIANGAVALPAETAPRSRSAGGGCWVRGSPAMSQRGPQSADTSDGQTYE